MRYVLLKYDSYDLDILEYSNDSEYLRKFIPSNIRIGYNSNKKRLEEYGQSTSVVSMLDKYIILDILSGKNTNTLKTFKQIHRKNTITDILN